MPHVTFFIDVEGTIRPGEAFESVIRERVAESDILIAVIGPDWISIKDSHGRRRLDDESDLVRIEIAEALRFGKVVIPVLLENATMPSGAQLPQNIAHLTGRHASTIRHVHFNSDAQRVARSIASTLAGKYPVQMLCRRFAVTAAILFVASSAAAPFMYRLIGVDIIGKTVENMELSRAHQKIRDLTEQVSRLEGKTPASKTGPEQLENISITGTVIDSYGTDRGFNSCLNSCLTNNKCIAVSFNSQNHICNLFSEVKSQLSVKGFTSVRGVR